MKSNKDKEDSGGESIFSFKNIRDICEQIGVVWDEDDVADETIADCLAVHKD